MTRKDYILLSDTIRMVEIVQEFYLAIGLALEKDNQNFDLKRFLEESEFTI